MVIGTMLTLAICDCTDGRCGFAGWTLIACLSGRWA